MLNDLGLVSIEEARQSALNFPYFREVFVAPPWEEIYTTDNERDTNDSQNPSRCTDAQPIGMVRSALS